MLGLASLLLVAMLASWGWRLFTSKRTPSVLGIRIAMFFISLILLSVCFAAVEAPVSWPIENGLGGAIGLLVRHWLLHVAPGFVCVLVCLALLVGALPVALGLTWTEWRAILRTIFRSGLFVLSVFSAFRPREA